MNHRIRRTLAIIAIGVCALTSSAMFIVAWSTSEPEWAHDVAWILLFVSLTMTAVSIINGHLVSNGEAFRIGIKVGRSGEDIDAHSGDRRGDSPRRGNGRRPFDYRPSLRVAHGLTLIPPHRGDHGPDDQNS